MSKLITAGSPPENRIG